MSYGGQDVSSGAREVTATAVRDEERTSMQGGGCLMLVPGGDARSCRGSIAVAPPLVSDGPSAPFQGESGR